MKKRLLASKSYWNEFIPESWIVFKKYKRAFFKDDLIAGITVGIVALPLAMAFALASGLPPEKGIYTAIVAGFLISFLGGSRLQIGGPTGAFVVIIYSVLQRQGYEGLALATLLAGAFLIIGGLARIGSWIKYIPYPLITGFTTGIAVIIFSSQVKDFLGLSIQNLPAEFIPKWMALFRAMPTLHTPTLLLALGTLGIIILIRKFYPLLPWGITAVVIATALASFFDLPVETILTRFGPIDNKIPLPAFPHFSQGFSEIPVLIADAFTIAFLAGIESLLSAIVADGMGGTRHRSNAELLGQGIANIASIFFGGIPATGAIARTATNVKSGAKTPLSGMIHALTLLFIILALAPLVSRIPLAALSAVLMMIAWNMSEIGHFKHLFKAPPGDVGVLLVTFLLTVFVDLTVAVGVGMMLAALLFMKRIADLPGVRAFPRERQHHVLKEPIPEGVEVYQIMGPLFFGVAETLKDLLSNIELPPKVCIVRMDLVPVIDATGLHVLKQLHFKCKREGTKLLITEVQPKVREALKRFGVVTLVGESHFFPTIESALNTM